jgi:hypothetical protein
MLGEFWRILANFGMLGECLHWAINENYKSLWATFFHGKRYAAILTKMGWALFWAMFSQTRQVTLHAETRTFSMKILCTTFHAHKLHFFVSN